MNDIIDCLIHGIRVGESYRPSVRAFCISLYSTSPKAYNYVRNKFGKNIPHPETIREWFRNSNLDASSGISQHSMDALEKMANNMANATPKRQLIVGLLMDEMAIKRNLMWNRTTNKFIGLTDCGAPSTDDEFVLADNVSVFMVSGLNVYFQQPIAYYFIKTIKSWDRANLVIQIVTELSKRNIKVKVLTFDGYSSNALMCEHLGLDFKKKDGSFITHFINPHDDSKVYVMYDPSHMEKLVRNTLGNIGVFYVANKQIKWKYFEELVKFSHRGSLGLTHKMNKRHIDWKNRKMHVRTAVETLSSSVANSMEFLMENGIPEFADAEATIEYTRIFDKLWDVMNTHRINTKANNVYKSALNEENKGEVFIFLHKAKEYILSLKMKHPKTGKIIRIVESTFKTRFRGYVISIISLIDVYFELVEEHHWLTFFATYRISQDHLEMLFGKIRSMNGHNDNPMAHQFASAYRKILHQCDISHSPYSNVKALADSTTNLVTSNILTVPSFRKLRSNLNECVELYNNLREQHNCQTSSDIFEEADEGLDLEILMLGEYLTDNTFDAGIAYIANSIECRLSGSSQVYCTRFCVKVRK